MIADVFIDVFVGSIRLCFGTFNVTNANDKTNDRCPISAVPVTSLLLEKHVVLALGSINTAVAQKSYIE